jgi:hypothetical protein
VTSLLEQARRVEQDLDALVGAQAEVERITTTGPAEDGLRSGARLSPG